MNERSGRRIAKSPSACLVLLRQAGANSRAADARKRSSQLQNEMTVRLSLMPFGQPPVDPEKRPSRYGSDHLTLSTSAARVCSALVQPVRNL